jgi:PPP family 3-phenylpropionic acid transporter
MATINIVGICAYWVYYGPLIESKGLTPKIVGLSIGVGTLSEVILIFFFEKLKKWLGLELLIILSILISMGRWQVIAHTSNPWVLVGIQVLHSEIGLFTMACITFVTDNVARKLVTTGQTIFYTLTYGVGQYFGIMLMGYLFDYYKDPSKLFSVSSFIHIIPLVMIGYIWIIRKKKGLQLQ